MRLSPESRAALKEDTYYPNKGQSIAVRPTDIGLQILEAAQARTGRDYDDIVEHLLRTGGVQLTFDETTARSTG